LSCCAVQEELEAIKLDLDRHFTLLIVAAAPRAPLATQAQRSKAQTGIAQSNLQLLLQAATSKDTA
jgi:hypothetical protein